MRPQGDRRQGGGPRREKPEYDQKVLDIRRTARVVAGGRRFSFRASVVIGNRNGKVGLGMGKGADVSSAVEKAVAKAKKDMLIVAITKTKTIPYEVEGKSSAARVLLKPAQEGRGLVAGGPIRIVADLAGIRHITAKILSRTPNKLNNARATMEALKKLKPIKVPARTIAPAAIPVVIQ
ncbi:MAG: 30S ribosomal protein S5 [Candidatus Sungbacteria bacterium]|nr:30S ribosomal protein S5 [Candidatus Sungbacteria bacterium]